MREKHIPVTRTARYFLLGDPGADIEQVWFVLHGYGHLASIFIKKFACLQNESRLIVAPEALSRFYLHGFTDRVGASWMTREDRLNEIADYIAYLDALYSEVIRTLRRDQVQVVVLGFSQGTATASRWICRGSIPAAHLILWGGLPAPELDPEVARRVFAACKLTLVFGQTDATTDAATLSEHTEILRQQRIPFRLRSFDGGHELHEDLLIKLAEVI